jgi:hypothetical protein
MKYIVRWFHPRGPLMERHYKGERAFLEARLKYESLVRCLPNAQPRLVDGTTGLIYSGGRWCTEEQCA